jgi:glycosyltransferase involved in cell wall biosynthesis
MNVLYHVTTLPPRMPRAEAISQEIAALRAGLGGEAIHVNPNQHVRFYVPRLLFGFHKFREIRAHEARFQIHNLYNPDPFPFPYLRALRRPVIYSITCGVGDRRPRLGYFAALAAVAVTDRRSLERLKSWGLDNVVRVRPGIDTERFTCTPLPLRSEIRVMVGSAPWTQGQFRSKGVEALLLAARQMPRLHLVFLWRGVLEDEMQRRVRQMGLAERVMVLNELVDVNEVLAGVHASVTLATAPGIVKAYPHSLLESLAAGKPVLVSRAIPMADYVERTGCGRVVDQVTPEGFLAAVESLASEYSAVRKRAEEVGQRDFSQAEMIASFREMYERILR